MHLRLRAATNADREAVTNLVFGILEEYGLCADPGCTDADLSDIEGFYAGREGFFDVLVTEEGEIVGSVGLCPAGEGACELRKMYLTPAARGQGHGRRLLEHALRRARELNYRRVVLETASVLKTAIKLYERYGFRRYEPDHKSSRCDAAYCLDLNTRRTE